jgi:nucleoside-diphosphate-sugar epimerase
VSLPLRPESDLKIGYNVQVRILLIGGTGFIGSFVVSQLVSGHHELAVVHRGSRAAPLPETVTSITGDRHSLHQSADAIAAFRPEVVIDMILSSGSQASALIDVVSGIARRVVALSSMDVYRACGVLHGFEPGPLEPLPLTEDSPRRSRRQTYPPAQLAALQQVFGWLDAEYDKVAVEDAILGDTRLPGTVLRLPMVYGPGDPLHRFFPVLKRIDDGRRAIVMEEGFARWRSPRGYVENVAAAVVLAAVSDQASGRVYNVAEEAACSEEEWAREIAAVAEWTGEIVVLPAHRTPPHLRVPYNVAQHWVADTTRIRRELGYRESVGRREAIARTIAWERAHPPARIDAAQFDYAAEDRALADILDRS